MAAAAAVTEADLRLEVLEAAAGVVRDRRLAGFALEEARGLEELASNLQRQAESGRISEGEAARAKLAAVSGWTEYARVRSQAALSTADLGRLLGVDSAVVQVDIPPCTGGWTPGAGSLPDTALVRARSEAAEGRVREARAAGIPDITPQAGLRRSAGFSALYLGIEIPIPLFNRNQGEREAARQEVQAVREDARDILLGLQAEREAAVRSLEAIEDAGARFSQDWRNALDRTMEAAEARYRLGEGTLTELLDSRRARLQALGDRERWQAERLIWRARAARYSGQEITAGSVCGASADLNQTISIMSDTEEVR
jgi:cobalt-zinc-cadmium efflux system outer membrane protein